MDTGHVDEAYVNGWTDLICKDTSPETEWVHNMDVGKRRDYVSRHVQSSFRVARELHAKANPILYFYTCDAFSATRLAEYAMFKDEWGDSKIAIASYADYAIWYLDKMLEAGMQGVYDDNTFICCNFNWATGEAKVDKKGIVQHRYVDLTKIH